MYKVLAPLPGYGYCIGDETKYISEKDAEIFIKQKKIVLISDSKSEEDPEREALVLKFEELSGKKAGNMKLETLQKKIEELEK